MAITPDSIVSSSQLGAPLITSPFSPSANHTRIFLAYLGDWFIRGRVTTVSGEKSANSQSFQLSLAGAIGAADLVSQNLAEDLVIYAAWRDNYSGEIVSQSEILRGKITSTSLSKGGRSATLMIFCRQANAPASLGAVHYVDGVEFFSFGGAGTSIRLPLQFAYEIGDRVIFSQGNFLIQKLAYTIDTRSAVITITG